MPTTKRLFTPALANKTLPLVRRIVRDILERGQELRAVAGKDREARRRVEGELRPLLKELEMVGCSYKDWSFDMGLVDFPSRIDGQEVLLCWRSDEEAVTHYHTAEAGFAGRRPIPSELL